MPLVYDPLTQAIYEGPIPPGGAKVLALVGGRKQEIYVDTGGGGGAGERDIIYTQNVRLLDELRADAESRSPEELVQDDALRSINPRIAEQLGAEDALGSNRVRLDPEWLAMADELKLDAESNLPEDLLVGDAPPRTTLDIAEQLQTDDHIAAHTLDIAEQIQMRDDISNVVYVGDPEHVILDDAARQSLRVPETLRTDDSLPRKTLKIAEQLQMVDAIKNVLYLVDPDVLRTDDSLTPRLKLDPELVTISDVSDRVATVVVGANATVSNSNWTDPTLAHGAADATNNETTSARKGPGGLGASQTGTLVLGYADLSLSGFTVTSAKLRVRGSNGTVLVATNTTTFAYSLNNGSTWTDLVTKSQPAIGTLTFDELYDIPLDTQTEMNQLQVRAISTVSGLGTQARWESMELQLTLEGATG